MSNRLIDIGITNYSLKVFYAVENEILAFIPSKIHAYNLQVIQTLTFMCRHTILRVCK